MIQERSGACGGTRSYCNLVKQGKNQLWGWQVTSCSRQTLGGLTWLRSRKMGLEEEWVEGGGGGRVGCCGRGTGTAFLFVAPAVPGGGTTCSQLRYSETAEKHLAQCWECPVCGSALFNLIFCAPRVFVGPWDRAGRSPWSISEGGRGWSQLLGTKPRAFPSSRHPLGVPIL